MEEALSNGQARGEHYTRHTHFNQLETAWSDMFTGTRDQYNGYVNTLEEADKITQMYQSSTGTKFTLANQTPNFGHGTPSAECMTTMAQSTGKNRRKDVSNEQDEGKLSVTIYAYRRHHRC